MTTDPHIWKQELSYSYVNPCTGDDWSYNDIYECWITTIAYDNYPKIIIPHYIGTIPAIGDNRMFQNIDFLKPITV